MVQRARLLLRLAVWRSGSNNGCPIIWYDPELVVLDAAPSPAHDQKAQEQQVFLDSRYTQFIPYTIQASQQGHPGQYLPGGGPLQSPLHPTHHHRGGRLLIHEFVLPPLCRPHHGSMCRFVCSCVGSSFGCITHFPRPCPSPCPSPCSLARSVGDISPPHRPPCRCPLPSDVDHGGPAPTGCSGAGSSTGPHCPIPFPRRGKAVSQLDPEGASSLAHQALVRHCTSSRRNPPFTDLPSGMYVLLINCLDGDMLDPYLQGGPGSFSHQGISMLQDMVNTHHSSSSAGLVSVITSFFQARMFPTKSVL
jgi:hypothetical protein